MCRRRGARGTGRCARVRRLFCIPLPHGEQIIEKSGHERRLPRPGRVYCRRVPLPKRGGATGRLVTVARSAVSRAGSRHVDCRRKRPLGMQHRLKAPPGSARTGIVPPELLGELLVAVYHAVAALDPRLATGTPGGACSSVRGSSVLRDPSRYLLVRLDSEGTGSQLAPPRISRAVGSVCRYRR